MRREGGFVLSSFLVALLLSCGGISEDVGDVEQPLPPEDGDPCWNYDECGNCISPIILDLAGNGFALTSAEDGVQFDMLNNGQLHNMYGWTAAGSDDAWLVLDRNGDGLINDSSELFGNHTAQPATTHPNGYLALKEYDLNSDGVINASDPVYTDLRLWRDLNHNGVSDPGELDTLAQHGVLGLSLDYRVSKAVDDHGNAFKYRANVIRAQGSVVGPRSYDVFLVSYDPHPHKRPSGGCSGGQCDTTGSVTGYFNVLYSGQQGTCSGTGTSFPLYCGFCDGPYSGNPSMASVLTTPPCRAYCFGESALPYCNWMRQTSWCTAGSPVGPFTHHNGYMCPQRASSLWWSCDTRF